MKTALRLVLVASLGLNLLLYLPGVRWHGAAPAGASSPAGAAPRAAGVPGDPVRTRPPAGPAGAPPDPTSPAPAAGGGAGTAATRARLEDLERQTAAVRARLDAFQGQDFLAALEHSTRDLRWKLRLIAGLAPTERPAAAHRLLMCVLGHPEATAQLAAALAEETDPAVLEVVGSMIGMGALAMGPPDEATAERFRTILRTGDRAERRLIAAFAVASADPAGRTPRWGEDVAAAIRTEADPQVIGALATGLHLFAGAPIPPAVAAALRDRLEGLPAGQGRIDSLRAIGKATFAQDAGAELYRLWSAAAAPDLRADCAQALAACGAECEAPRAGPGGGLAPAAAPQGANRTGFLSVYEGTTDLATRRLLVRSAALGLGLTPRSGPDAVRFLQDLTLREPDAAQRDCLTRAAAAVEAGAALDQPEVTRLIFGR